MTFYSFVIPTNPEPWKVGPMGVGRKGGKPFPTVAPDPNLQAYQEAVREWFDAEVEAVVTEGPYQVRLYFYRQLASYQDSAGRRRHRNAADATNMQKATEDALQGCVIDNDRNVHGITSFIAVQDREVRYPCVAIELADQAVLSDPLFPVSLFPREMLPMTKNSVKRVIMGEHEVQRDTALSTDNEWPPRS